MFHCHDQRRLIHSGQSCGSHHPRYPLVRLGRCLEGGIREGSVRYWIRTLVHEPKKYPFLGFFLEASDTRPPVPGILCFLTTDVLFPLVDEN